MGAPCKILLTTSRRPTPRIRAFCNDLARVIPCTVRVNRGKMSMEGVAEEALKYGADRVIVVDRWHGGPSKIEFFRVGASGLMGISPVFFVYGIRLQREFGHLRLKPAGSLAVITPSEGDEETAKVVSSLSRFFNIPTFSANEKTSGYAMEMRVSYDATHGIQITFASAQRNVEVGPRITLAQVLWETTQ